MTDQANADHGQHFSQPPRRVQLRRTKGWRMPPNTTVVTRATRWGNPHRVVNDDRAAAVEAFKQWLPGSGLDLTPLRGRNLACFCPPDEPCHADVLLDEANQ